MGLLDTWVERFRWLWTNRPENAMALAMQMLDVGSPLARQIFRVSVFNTDGNGTEIFALGPRSAGSPQTILDPVGKEVLIFHEFTLGVSETTGSEITDYADSRLTDPSVKFLFGAGEDARPELPPFAPLDYLTDKLGAIKPRIIIPRGQDLRCRFTEDGGGAASRVVLSVFCRSEPRRLMEAARLVEPDTVGREGRL